MNAKTVDFKRHERPQVQFPVLRPNLRSLRKQEYVELSLSNERGENLILCVIARKKGGSEATEQGSPVNCLIAH